MIVRYPNSILLTPARKQTLEDCVHPSMKELVEGMFKELEEAKGVGLAAQQVNVIDSVFVINFKDKEQLFTGIFINPELVGHSNETTTAPEMCLSFPNLSVNKERWKWIKLRWLDIEGKEHEEIFEGFKAVVLQHEYDHVQGKTIISSLPALKQKMLVEKMRKNLKKKSRNEIKSARQRAKEMGISMPPDAQEHLDVLTGKRMVDE